ncbi:MAG: hypothetical protein AB8F26_13345 [Phycisphaerales bacterium]
MDNVKPWQVILLVAAVGALGFSAWKFGFGGDRLSAQMSNGVIMMDVNTGELFEYSLKGRRGVMVPGENPNSGELSLMPVQEDEQGRWYITNRDMDALQYVEVEASRVDRATGTAEPVDTSPTRVDN